MAKRSVTPEANPVEARWWSVAGVERACNECSGVCSIARWRSLRLGSEGEIDCKRDLRAILRCNVDEVALLRDLWRWG